MAKLNTYPVRDELVTALQLIGIIPGTGSAFETVRVTSSALIEFIEEHSAAGTNGKEVELRASTTHIEWRYVGDAAWKQLVALADLKGNPGEQVEMRKTATHVQWKYASSADWTDLILLSDIRGTNGTNGQTMWSVAGAPSAALGVDGDFSHDINSSTMYGPKASGSWGTGISYKGVKGDTGTGLVNKGAWVTGTTYIPGDYVFSTGSASTSSMWILNGSANYLSTTLPKDDPTHWVEFVAPAGEDGVDGKSVELRKAATVIQWRMVGDAAWADLVSLVDITGANGTNGNSVLSTTGIPAAGFGVNGDFANDATNSVMYGPKAAGAWPAGVSYKGGPGSNGAAGSKWLTGSTVPAAGTGANGDFYLRNTGDVYGPKAAGAWGAIVASIKGATGNPGAGVPVGGTTGQILAKKTNTDLDTEWIAAPTGGGSGGAGDVVSTGNNTLSGDNTFTGKLIINGGSFIQNARSVYPAASAITSGSTIELPTGIGQIRLNTVADLAALTIRLPAYEVSGSIIRVYCNHNITAVTLTPASDWQGPLKIYGSITTITPGWFELQWWEDGSPGWYVRT